MGEDENGMWDENHDRENVILKSERAREREREREGKVDDAKMRCKI